MLSSRKDLAQFVYTLLRLLPPGSPAPILLLTKEDQVAVGEDLSEGSRSRYMYQASAFSYPVELVDREIYLLERKYLSRISELETRVQELEKAGEST